MSTLAVPASQRQTLSSIDWKRIAEPQSDGYDSRVAFALMQENGYERRPTSKAPACFDGQVAIRNDYVPDKAPFATHCVAAPLDHPNIARGCDLVRHWPPVFARFQQLIDSIYVLVNSGWTRDEVTGAICGAGPEEFGTIVSTVNHHVGFAEALVHEMAHHKLRALGVGFTSAQRLIRNPPEQQFLSMKRLDRLRPMTAVLHAQYSYTYVTALDIEIIRAATDTARDRIITERSLAVNLPKLEFGLAVIRDNIQTDRDGGAFLDGLFNWTSRVLAAGYVILQERNIAPVPFVHPLAARRDAPDETESVNARAQPQRASGVMEVPMGDDMLLYSPAVGRTLSLNSSARAIWELCNGRHTLGEISRELSRQSGVTTGVLFSDVVAAASQLRELGLIEYADRAE